MTVEQRLERLERVVALLALERYGISIRSPINTGALRQEAREDAVELLREVAESSTRRLHERTPIFHYSGDVDALREFCGDAATVNPDDMTTAAWVIQNGDSMRVRAGQTVARDPQTGKFFTKETT
jgi:hypothetical protein